MTRYYPRLALQMDTHADRPDDPQWRTFFPDVEIQVRELSLADAAMQRLIWDESGKSLPSGSKSRIVSCSRNMEDAPAVYDVPPWYTKQKNDDCIYTWPSVVSSFAGTMIRRKIWNGLEDMLRPACGPLGPVQSIEQLLRKCAKDRQQLSICLMDGDRVGRMFVETPLFMRPGLSIELGHALLHGIEEGLKQTIIDMDINWLPVDIVYQGGDDVMFFMPSGMTRTFFEAFGRQWFNGLPITFTAAELVADFSAGTDNLVPFQLDGATRVRELLPRAKQWFREGGQNAAPPRGTTTYEIAAGSVRVMTHQWNLPKSIMNVPP